MADVLQQQIRRHRSLLAVARGGIAGTALALGLSLAALPVIVCWPDVVMLLLVTLLAVRETRVLGRLRATAAVMPAERPQAHAEAVAVAIEMRRRQEWDVIARQAYRARPPDPKRLAAAPASKPPMSALPPAVTLPVTSATTMAGFEAGIARLTASLGGCAHPNAEPVDLLVTGERVAWTCPDCPAELPADWR
jgi:hypothetical protein